MRFAWVLSMAVIGGMVSVAVYSGMHTAPRADLTTPIFPGLFPRPTGHNGYEEFVSAADLLDGNPGWHAFNDKCFEKPAPTLAMKRMALSDSSVVQALAALRSGLKKPAFSPRASQLLFTLYPELASFRQFGQMFGAEIDLEFADGKSSEALKTLKDALRFVHTIQAGPFMSGGVTLLIEHIVLFRFSEHLDQLSVQDCDELIRLAREYLARPDPSKSLVAQERDMYARTLARHRSDAYNLLIKIEPAFFAGTSDHKDIDDLRQSVKENPESGPAVIDQAAAIIGSHFDLTLAELSRPIWQRQYPVLDGSNTPGGKLARSMCRPSHAYLCDRVAREQALLQILGAHAAFRRYRLQHGGLPANLGELNLGDLAIDPFTGEELGYTRLDGSAYTVSSVGPYDQGDSQHPPTGHRIPVAIPYPPHP